ncbi:MAG: sugar ABC transporter permease [Anaerolineales bacterium]|nr:sugar ABC transporter permease [Anaerolineales bacterium]
MQLLEDRAAKGATPASTLLALLGRIALAILIPVIAFYVLIQGFLFLRDGEAPKLVITLTAIAWGVGGVAVLYWIFNWIVEALPEVWTARLQPYIFVGPAMAILVWFLALPTVRTFYISLFDRDGPEAGVFVGLKNYLAVFTESNMLEAFRNNIFFWILIATPITVVSGLVIAALADRSNFERVAKSLIFLPMAISFVGAGIIWNFIYEVKPPDTEQIGLLNAIVVAFGGEPQAWTAYATISPWNNLFLIVIVVWLQAGYSMVLFSAALKGIPEEIIEAARMDGATEFQIFLKIMIPSIMGTIITVTTTVLIFTLKIFDVVWVMTGAQFGTGVIATEFYRQSFTARNAGYGAAIAIVLLIAVIPVMIYNLRQFRQQEAF